LKIKKQPFDSAQDEERQEAKNSKKEGKSAENP